jgi:hypothetical protein
MWTSPQPQCSATGAVKFQPPNTPLPDPTWGSGTRLIPRYCKDRQVGVGVGNTGALLTGLSILI